jgi:hypothetical protein
MARLTEGVNVGLIEWGAAVADGNYVVYFRRRHLLALLAYGTLPKHPHPEAAPWG